MAYPETWVTKIRYFQSKDTLKTCSLWLDPRLEVTDINENLKYQIIYQLRWQESSETRSCHQSDLRASSNILVKNERNLNCTSRHILKKTSILASFRGFSEEPEFSQKIWLRLIRHIYYRSVTSCKKTTNRLIGFGRTDRQTGGQTDIAQI